jgi:hypothetical protein
MKNKGYHQRLVAKTKLVLGGATKGDKAFLDFEAPKLRWEGWGNTYSKGMCCAGLSPSQRGGGYFSHFARENWNIK